MNESRKHQIKRAENMKNCKDEITNHFKKSPKYKNYDELFLAENFEELKFNKLSDEAKEAIKAKYQADQNKHLKPKIIERYKNENVSVTECAYCGCTQDTKSLQLDHVLPQSIFEDIAIYMRNLVLSCSSCNNKLDVHYISEDNKVKYHMFLHTLERISQFEMSIINNKIIFKPIGIEFMTDNNINTQQLNELSYIKDLSLTNTDAIQVELQLRYDEEGIEAIQFWYQYNKILLNIPSTNLHYKGIINAVGTFLENS